MFVKNFSVFPPSSRQTCGWEAQAKKRKEVKTQTKKENKQKQKKKRWHEKVKSSYNNYCRSLHNVYLRISPTFAFKMACINGSTRSDNIFRRVVWALGGAPKKNTWFRASCWVSGFSELENESIFLLMLWKFLCGCLENIQYCLCGWVEELNVRRSHFSRMILMIYQEQQTANKHTNISSTKNCLHFHFPIYSIFTHSTSMAWIV